MTVYVPFAPSTTAPFTFQATFDGNAYTVTCTWNLFGQRYYVNVSDLRGNHIFTLPMIGSPNGYNISLTGGYFATQLVFREPTGNFEVIG